MESNFIEKLVMHNPARVWYQKRFEAPNLLNIDLPSNAKCLEIGCGRGVGSLLINKYFDCEEVIGIDYDPDMIDNAKKYICRASWARDIDKDNLEFRVENASNLPFPDNHFDAVFAFWVLHHIEDWKKAISEASRTLKPDGYFYFEEFFPQSFFRSEYCINGLIGNRAEYIELSEKGMKKQLKQNDFQIESYKKPFILPARYIIAKKNSE